MSVLDRILMFAVVIGPTLFALGTEIVSEGVRKNPYWKRGVIAFGLVLSGLTFWQISAQERNASTEREGAIERVSKEVSASVTKTVGDQYQAVVSSLTNQIAYLKGQLAFQTNDLKTIKSSNIVTGKKPVAVKVINPQPAEPVPQPVNISWTQTPAVQAGGQYSVTIIVNVDNFVAVPAFLATCSGPCHTEDVGVFGVSSAEPLYESKDPNVAGFVFRIPRPLSPNLTVQWKIVSSVAISVLKVRLLAPQELPESMR